MEKEKLAQLQVGDLVKIAGPKLKEELVEATLILLRLEKGPMGNYFVVGVFDPKKASVKDYGHYGHYQFWQGDGLEMADFSDPFCEIPETFISHKVGRLVEPQHA